MMFPLPGLKARTNFDAVRQTDILQAENGSSLPMTINLYNNKFSTPLPLS